MAKKRNADVDEEGADLSPYNSILPQDPKDAMITQNAPRSTSQVGEQYRQRGIVKEVQPLKSRELRSTPRAAPVPTRPKAVQGTEE